MRIFRRLSTILLEGIPASSVKTMTMSRSLSTMLEVSPASSLFDTEVVVRGRSLTPGARVTLEVRLEDRGQHFDFRSESEFLTGGDCEFSTGTDSPLSGSSYHGVHSSGPLWSVQRQPRTKYRLWPQDITQPLHYQLTLTCSHSGQVLSSASAVKTFLGPGVRRLEVREGAIRGTLFLPPNPGPAIITIYGGVNNGKVPEDRAALLASYGYVTLALAFYGVDDLPPLYDSFDMNYFESAVDFLLSQPQVTRTKVGLFGSSTGGNLVLSMMSCLGAKIGASVVSGAAFASCPGHTHYNGQIIVQRTEWKFEQDWENPFGFKGGLQAMLRNERQQIQFEKSPAPLLVIVGEEDNLYREARDIAPLMIERARKAGKKNVKLLKHPGAGHLMDLPHSPFSGRSSHPVLPPGMKFDYGGQPQLHALAQILAWRETLEFFNYHL